MIPNLIFDKIPVPVFFEGDAQLLMGIAYYSQKQPQQALTWFGRASRHEGTAQEANTWLRYIERELQSG